VCTAYAGLSIFFCWPLFAQPRATGILDWDIQLLYSASVLKNVVEYGQLPFWNPWYCGGNVLWQNPQVALLSPVYLFALVVPLALAVKLNVALHYFVGFLGMHRLLNEMFELDSFPLIMFFGSIFVLSGALAMHVAVGHVNFLPAFYLPLILFHFLRSLIDRTVRDVIWAAALLALTIYNGGLHIVPMALVAIGSIAAWTAVAWRGARPLILALTLCATGFAYAAPKLLPVALFVTSDQFLDGRPPTGRADRMTEEMLLRAFLDPYQTRGTSAGWLEYGNFIGLPAALLIFASIIWSSMTPGLPRAWLGRTLALSSVLLLAITAGDFARFAPASLLHRLPFFSSFRLPSRYSIAFVLMAVATTAWTCRLAMPDAARVSRGFVAVLCTMATLYLATINRGHFEGVFQGAPVEDVIHPFAHGPAPIADAEVNSFGPGSPMFRALAGGRSAFNCYEVMLVQRSAMPDRPLVYAVGDARLFDTVFSPNRIDFAVAAGVTPSRVLLNTNFASGWTSTAGVVTRDAKGGPKVDLAAGRTGRFSFRFVPPGLVVGVGLLFAALIGTTFVWRNAKATSKPTLVHRAEPQ
jgi:hypothetical protein